MIAYNYCYSTCLGKIGDHVRRQFGVTDIRLEYDTVAPLRPYLHISPNGVLFVQRSVRAGVLPCMLDEILRARVMIKTAMKTGSPADRALMRMLDARQHNLKMVANVTYGYTGASYSGRMPCADLADAIVATGRHTLERAIRLVQARASGAPGRFGARH